MQNLKSSAGDVIQEKQKSTPPSAIGKQLKPQMVGAGEPVGEAAV